VATPPEFVALLIVIFVPLSEMLRGVLFPETMISTLASVPFFEAKHMSLLEPRAAVTTYSSGSSLKRAADRPLTAEVIYQPQVAAANAPLLLIVHATFCWVLVPATSISVLLRPPLPFQPTGEDVGVPSVRIMHQTSVLAICAAMRSM